mmetsp:Transcript_48048/g.78323  ORF Transcript_48048/g.78323 Transcript_48048/m.78323 type:complete len:96 (-) Transcript_48048:299-586(-)
MHHSVTDGYNTDRSCSPYASESEEEEEEELEEEDAELSLSLSLCTALASSENFAFFLPFLPFFCFRLSPVTPLSLRASRNLARRAFFLIISHTAV